MSAQTFSSPAEGPIALFTAVRLARRLCQPDPAILWVDEGAELVKLLQSRDDLAGLSLFAAGDAAGLEALAAEKGVNLTVSPRPPVELMDELSANLARHQSWERALLRSSFAPQPMQAMADTAAEVVGGCCFLVDAAYQVAYYSQSGDLCHPIAQSMLDRKRLPLDQLPHLLERQVSGVSHLPLSDGWNCCYRSTGRTGSIAGVVLFRPDPLPAEEAELLTELLVTTIGRYLQIQKQKSTALTFQSLLPDLIDGKLSSEEEIDCALAALPTPPKRFYGFLLVSMANPKIFPNARQALMTQLSHQFPESSVAQYGSIIVLLLSGSDRSVQPQPKFDREKLRQLLHHYDAYAAFGNATSRRDMFRTQYTLAASTLEMGQALRRDSQERIFLFEDYAEYISIDLCVNTFSALLGHDDIIYLTHPSVTTVYRYDMAHQTNLMEILYHYCISNCNVSQAAKRSYMHRNTFSAQLKELRNLADLDFSDGEIRQRVIFSYKILRYYDRYVKVNLMNRFSVSPPVPEPKRPEKPEL